MDETLPLAVWVQAGDSMFRQAATTVPLNEGLSVQDVMANLPAMLRQLALEIEMSIEESQA